MAIAALIISIISLFGSGYALVLKKQSSDREKRREEYESKTRLYVSCEYDYYNNRYVQIGKPFQVGQQLRFSLVINNYGFRSVFIKQILLMSSNPSAIHKLHEFSLNNSAERTVKPSNPVNLELSLTLEKLKKLIDPEVKKTVFIRVITDSDSFFDSIPAQIEL